MENLKELIKIFKKQTTINKILLILALLYVIIITIACASAIGWIEVFLTLSFSYLLNFWKDFSNALKEKSEENKNKEETH